MGIKGKEEGPKTVWEREGEIDGLMGCHTKTNRTSEPPRKEERKKELQQTFFARHLAHFFLVSFLASLLLLLPRSSLAVAYSLRCLLSSYFHIAFSPVSLCKACTQSFITS